MDILRKNPDMKLDYKMICSAVFVVMLFAILVIGTACPAAASNISYDIDPVWTVNTTNSTWESYDDWMRRSDVDAQATSSSAYFEWVAAAV